ncbi:VQ motif-containing protein 10 [Ziziphus jujuba]|uniref:VQ motif-containing protein 10 n=2 Tax=Ziziphus jujuba TaxID=326968 RepID=A0A6P3YX81_ZIZJJ|nr:VQ motif-containing protein 10 [Ziziphus jujuba]KAH7545156.1 hypothetical protein FEM48_Zijuj01G0063700 [Ziziphus jujuba var. spinosa]
MASSNPEAVKVVLIDTQYIQTDPMSFKSVVQSLTGKDSCVAWINKRSFTGDAAKRKRSAAVHQISDIVNGGVSDRGSDHGNNISLLSKGMSFKDLDRMMLEIPSMEDLQYWFSEAQKS